MTKPNTQKASDMTLRQYYAAQVVSGLCTQKDFLPKRDYQNVIKIEFSIADAMIEYEKNEREKNGIHG